MRTLFGSWTMDAIAVIELSNHEWRVTDLRTREADGMAVLGVIEREDRAYFATALGSPNCRRRFDHFGAAVQYLESYCQN